MESTTNQPGQLIQASVQVPHKSIDIRSFINSPWLLLVVPLLIGGFWLVLNPWVITDNLNKPYSLLAGPSLVGSCLVGWLVFRFFRTIEAWCKLAVQAFLRARKEDGSAQFFWIVIAVFLVVSVFASGSFFSILEREAFPGMGYATALFIDLVAVQCMRARLNATRMRDKRGALLYLLGVFICAGASAWANVYTSLESFTDKGAGALPLWMIGVAPWFGLVFPALIVLLSMTADYTVDQGSGGRLEPGTYKAHEEKRVKLLEIQRDTLKNRVAIEREIDALTTSLKRGKDGRVFFLVAWLFPRQKHSVQTILEEVQRLYEPHLTALTEQNEQLLKRLQTLEQVEPLVTDTIDPLASKVLTLAQLNEQLSLQVQALQQIQPLDAATLITDITRQLDAVYGSRFSQLDTRLSSLVADVQTLDLPDGNEDTTSMITPYSPELIHDIQALLTSYPILERWLSSGRRSITLEEIIEVTGHSRKMVTNRVNDHTITRTRKAGFYRVSSVIEWLKVAPLPKGVRDTSTKLEAVKVPSNGHGKAIIKLDQLDAVTV